MPRWKRSSVRISLKLTLVANLTNQGDHSQQALPNQQIGLCTPALSLMERVAALRIRFQQEGNQGPHVKVRLSRALQPWENCSKATVNRQFRLLRTLNNFNRIWRRRLTCLITNQKKRWIAFKLTSKRVLLLQTTICSKVLEEVTSRSFKSSSLSVDWFRIANLGRLRACLTKFDEHSIDGYKYRYAILPIDRLKRLNGLYFFA